MNFPDYIIKLAPKKFFCKCQKTGCPNEDPEECFFCKQKKCFSCEKLDVAIYWNRVEKVAVAKESIEQIYNVTEDLLKKVTNDSPIHSDIAYIKAFCEFYLDIDGEKEK